MANPDPKRLKIRFALDDDAEIDERPRFNIAPTDPVMAIRERAEHRELGNLRWGLVPGKWAIEKKGRPLINARAEGIATQPAFAESFKTRRCLIPADGFYEWRKDENGKVPIHFAPADGEPFAFAGVWASYTPKGGEEITSCAIVTCEPNELIRPIHDRMPAILDRELETAWISDEPELDELLAMLRPAPDDFLVPREVIDAVNSVREDGPHLLDPRPKAETLF
jgi:putative SOS response-associated peptidase YedK